MFEKLRGRISLRLIWRVTLVVIATCFVAISVDAFVRGRLVSPADRVPTALYTRPVPWEGGGRVGGQRPPAVIGGLDANPLEHRIPVRLAEIPSHLIQAVLAVEDQRFYEHHGVDIRRIGGALLANLKAGGIREGGSTLTQQLAKNLYLTADRTPIRKIRELAFALTLEARHTKAEILEGYLNEIYLGQDGGRPIHGVGAAARYYFGKSVSRMILSESALLAGMIRAPNRYVPTRNPRQAERRREVVLQQMAEQGRISRSLADRARRANLPSRVYPAVTVDGRWVRDYARALLPERFPSRGAAIYSTIDARLQIAAQRAVRNGLSRLRAPGVEAALIALDPRTGEVLAMVGGRDYSASQFNRATNALRQPGSAFKPVVALAALERWGGQAPAFTLASMIEDEPLAVRTSTGLWEPANYDRQFRGSVTLRRAMEQSLNVPFARVGLALGPERIVAAGRRLGITSPLRPVPSLALGSSEVTLLELTRAYGVLAAGGKLSQTRIVYGTSRLGSPVVPIPATEGAPVVDPAVAYLVTSSLEGAVTRGTGAAVHAYWSIGEVAGKTGTSNDWRDAWFLAYSPSIVVGAWVGFDNGQSLGMTGATAALPIVASLLDQARAGEDESFGVPEGVTIAYAESGGFWPWECGTREVFLEGTEPERSGCFRFEIPEWDRNRSERDRSRRGEDWDRDNDRERVRDDLDRARQLGEELGRRAIRALEKLLIKAVEKSRNSQ